MGKEKRKELKRRFGWYALKLFIYINGILPLRLSYCLGYVFGSIAYIILWPHRKIAMNSLTIAFPEKSLKEKRKIARKFFIFMSQGSFELLHLLKHPERLDGTRIEGKEYLDKELGKNKGVILLTSHLGNFPLMSLKLAKCGYAVNILTRPLRDKKAGSYLHGLREKSGVKTIFSFPRRECIGNIIKALRNNEIVIMQMDQNFGTGGVWVKFFNKLAATPVGPIVLSLRTQASLVPGYMHRESFAKHCLRILPREDLLEGQDKNEVVLKNAIKLTQMIEGWIKENEDQWGWIHKRWKSQPTQAMMDLEYKVQK